MKLSGWYEIDEEQYMWYILQGYTIVALYNYVLFLMDDELHRTDGPAVEYPSGTNKWYINGIEYTEEEFNEVKL